MPSEQPVHKLSAAGTSAFVVLELVLLLEFNAGDIPSGNLMWMTF